MSKRNIMIRLYDYRHLIWIAFFASMFLANSAFASTFNVSMNITLYDANGHAVVNGQNCTVVQSQADCNLSYDCCVWDPPPVSITYCQNSTTLAINDTYEICGGSPVLNPSVLNCQNYTRHREEVCASGCDPNTAACTPLPIDRLAIIGGVIILILGFIVYLARRYG